MTNTYEPQFRYWVAEKSASGGWFYVCKTNSLWYARHLALMRTQKGYQMKVEAQW